jgi:hypothetical protein
VGEAGDFGLGERYRRGRGRKLQLRPGGGERSSEDEVEFFGKCLAVAARGLEHQGFLGQLGFHAQRVAGRTRRISRPLAGVFRHRAEPANLGLLQADRLIGEGQFDGIGGGEGAGGERGGAGGGHPGALQGLGLAVFRLIHPGFWQGLLNPDAEVSEVRPHLAGRGHHAEADHRVVPQAQGTHVLRSGIGTEFGGGHRRVVADGFRSQAGEKPVIQGLRLGRVQQAAGQRQTG